MSEILTSILRRIRLRRALPLLLMLPLSDALAFFDADASAPALVSQRDLYRQAMSAARRGHWKEFDGLRRQLDGYVLTPYLDYEKMTRFHRSTSGSEAREFYQDHRSGPLGLRYLDSYLHSVGKARRWGDFLAANPDEPRSERLRCYYARAKRSRGEEELAWRMAASLWQSGSSVDDACDPLFRLWKEQGGITDERVWARAQLAFAARESGLLRYVSSLASPRIQARLQALRRVYDQPQRTLRHSAQLAGEVRSRVLVLGLERFARYNPVDALGAWKTIGDEVSDPSGRDRVEHAIAFRGLLDREPQLRAWIDDNLSRWARDDFTEIRLRWAIADSDWEAIARVSTSLSPRKQSEAGWRYWKARSLEERGQSGEAARLYALAAQERGYYGFLSADRAKLPYRFRDNSSAAELQSVSTSGLPTTLDADALEALWRVHELFAVDEPRKANAEWVRVVRQQDDDTRFQLALLAHEQGWFSQGIDAANAANRHDYLALRFPLAYQGEFEKRAQRHGLPVSELWAIARRESAFFAQARSGVGARGLMQIMPATGIAVARTAGIKLNVADLYSVEHNLDLGSSYYRQLLERFDGNRAVALAAYNAGPNRVQNWVGKGLPMDAWIETIPYRETRAYVKAVLSYSVVFEYRLGAQPELFSADERLTLL